MSGKPPPKSRLGRIAQLSSLTSRVSGSYLGQRIKGAFQDDEARDASMRKLHIENAERVVKSMGALKGAAMKVGQSIALIADGMDLPPDVARVLGKLNDKAEPIPFSLIQRTVEAELEGSLADRFDRFDPNPLGTASLAQAHAARLKDGTPVVVKVLHQGVEHSVDTDLAALKSLLITGRVLRRDKEELEAFFEEVRQRLQEELDYYQEAANIEYFHYAMKTIPDIHVPRTYPSHCTDKVLTMDHVEGVPLDRFMEAADYAACQKAGWLLCHSFHDMFYRLRTLHADPHGGNYLFRKDGGLSLVDFGCVRRFDIDWVGDYGRMALAGVDMDKPGFFKASRKIGTLVGQSPEAEDLLWRLAGAIMGPLRLPYYKCGAPDDLVLEQVKDLAGTVLRNTELRSPPELVFLHRALGGVYSMMRKLRHEGDYGSFMRRHVRYAIGVAEGRIPDGSPVPA